MTFAAVVLWIKTFLASVPRSVYTHGLAFIVGVVLRGCLAVAPVLLLVSPAPAQPCPVNGSNCTCGCQQGGQCNCALTRVAPERLSRLDPQALAYRDLCEWAEKHPGVPVAVFVNIQPYIHGAYGPDVICRYDRGWPHLVGPWVIYAVFRDGEFTQFRQESLLPRLTTPRLSAFQPFGNFGGNCSSGNCRSR